MTSNIVKCTSCNIVINELLSFIQNKVDVMDEVSLVQICTSSFSTEEIEAAKNLLFQSIATTKRNITRKREGKAGRDLDDIISLLKGTDPELVPIFVARNLQKLPPITFDHVDVTRLLKDILVLQQDMKSIKESYATTDDLAALKDDIIFLRTASLINDQERVNVNIRRGGFIEDNVSLNCDSGPIGLPHFFDKTSDSLLHNNNNYNDEANSTREVNDRSARAYATVAKRAELHVEAPPRCTMVSTCETPTQLTEASVLRSGTSKRIDESLSSQRAQPTNSKTMACDGAQQKDDWILVQNKRKKAKERFRGQKGKASVMPGSKFRSADTQIPIFIYNVNKEASEQDIADYVYAQTQITVRPEKVMTKSEKEYNSFKMHIPKSKLPLFSEDTFWPENVFYRRYYIFTHREKKASESASVVTTGINESHQAEEKISS